MFLIFHLQAKLFYNCLKYEDGFYAATFGCS
jgi:hypothetical protein